MSRPIRIERPDLPVSVTVRCREGRRLLMPLGPIRELMLWRLAQAVELHGVLLYFVVQMGNHIHILCRAPQGNLSAFMRHFLGYLARDVNKLLGRRGDGIFRRHSQVHVLDDAAALERASYILANPARAHLVDSIDDWPGLSSAPAVLRGERMVGRHFDERAWRRAGCPDDRSPFEQEIELVHHRLPGYEDLDDEAYAATIREVVATREAEARAARTAPLPDPDALHDADPDSIPLRMKMEPCPHCHATCATAAHEYLETRKATRERYVVASTRWRQGDFAADFPPGTYRPQVAWTGAASERLRAAA